MQQWGLLTRCLPQQTWVALKGHSFPLHKSPRQDFPHLNSGLGSLAGNRSVNTQQLHLLQAVRSESPGLQGWAVPRATALGGISNCTELAPSEWK